MSIKTLLTGPTAMGLCELWKYNFVISVDIAIAYREIGGLGVSLKKSQIL
jgi:hypothetical protein